MPRRYFNWKLAIVLVISCAVICTAAFGLRRWRKANSAEQGLTLGTKAFDEHKWEEAAREFGRYISVNQNDVAVLLKYAEAQLNVRPSNTGHIQQAAQAYRAVLRIDSDNLEAAEPLTELYLAMGRYDDAELIASRQLEVNSNPELHRFLALALIRQRKFNQAAEELRTLCAENPEHILAFETTGQLAEQHPEEFSEPAAYWFDEVVRNNPSSALAYIVRAGFHRRNKDITEAVADLERAERQDLSDINTCLRLASEYINLQLLDKAEQLLTKVQTISSSEQRLWQLLAQLAIMLQSPERMINVAETGLKELSSQPWDFMPLAAELFIRSDALERASDCILKLKEKDFEPAIVSYLEGLLFAQEGNFLKAVEYWRYSIALGNNSIRTRLELSSALANLGDMQSALRQLKILVSEEPDSFEGYLTLARMLAQTSNWVEVHEYATKAMQLAPDNPELALLLMQAQMQLAGTGSNVENIEILQNTEKMLSQQDKTGEGSLEIELLRVQIEILKDNFPYAHELINQLKEEYSSEVKIALAEAELLTIQDKIDEAISALYQAIEKFPDSSGPVRYIAVLLNKQSDKDSCETVIKEALERIDDPVVQRNLTLQLVSFYANWGEQEKAYEQLEIISEKIPNDIPIKRRLLLCEQIIEKTDAAQQLVDNIKSLEGENGWQWRYEQARLWYISDDFKEYYPRIISMIQENLLSNPNDQDSRMLLGAAYEKAGELQLAISIYREALNRAPDNVRILTNLVSVLYKVKEYEQAEELLKRLPQHSLNDPQVQKLKFENYLREGQYGSASDILQGLFGSNPDDPGAGLALALLKMQQGQYEESEELLKRLKDADPKSLSVASAQIQLYIQLEKAQEALNVCNDLVKNINDVSAYILRARTYSALNQSEKALEDLTSAISIEPDNAEVWIARSDYYRSEGQQDKAIEDIRKALTLDSENEQIQKRAITLLLTSNQPALMREGNDILDRALETNPDDVELQMYKVNSLLESGTAQLIEDACQILQKITEENPELSRAWLMLGQLMLNKNQPGTAMDTASRGLAYNPNEESLLLLKARAEAVRSPVLAVPTLKVLCELNPNNVEAVTLLARIYVTTNELEKAVSFLQEKLAICDPTNTRTYDIALASAQYKTGKKAESLQKLDSFLEAEPDDPAPLLAQVYLLRDDRLWSELRSKTRQWYQKHPDDSRIPEVIARNLMSLEAGEAKKVAEEIFRMILENDSNQSEAMHSLAILLETTGRSKEAINLYQKMIALDPDNVIAINNLAWILCENQGQPQRALELAQKGLNLAPDYADLIDTRGMAYYRLGQFEKAVQDFSRCIELYPDSTPQDTASRFHLAKAYFGLKNNKKALTYLKEVLDLENQSGSLNANDHGEARSLWNKLQEDI